MAFDSDRIDGTLALPLLRPENVSVRGDKAMISCDCRQIKISNCISRQARLLETAGAQGSSDSRLESPSRKVNAL